MKILSKKKYNKILNDCEKIEDFRRKADEK